MSSTSNILAEILAELPQYRDAERAPKMKAYMKDHFEYLGVDSNSRKKAVSAVWKIIQKPNKEEMFALMTKLWSQPYREYQYVAMDISSKYLKTLNPKDLPRIAFYIEHKSWWDTVDFLASNLVGGAIANQKKEIKDLIAPFIKSKDMWMRRSAILCQLKFKGEVDTAVLAECILQTIHEKDFFIRKAHGWALRQYSKFNPKWVADFIKANDPQLSNLAIKEGSKYLI